MRIKHSKHFYSSAWVRKKPFIFYSDNVNCWRAIGANVGANIPTKNKLARKFAKKLNGVKQ